MKSVAIVVVFSSLLSAAQPAGPLVIAHRGASGYLPEHTLEAKAFAYALGADLLEQDLVLSKDDVPVVLHDIFLDTVTDVAIRFPDRKRADGRYYAIDFTLAELKRLNVMERFSAKTGKAVFPDRFPSGKAAFQIATLEEELQLIEGLNRSTGRRVGIYPELKQPRWHREQGKDLGAIVLPLLAKYGYASKSDPCWLQCFEYTEVRRLRETLDWKGRLIFLMGGAEKGDDGTDYDFFGSNAGLDELAGVVDGIGPALDRIVTWTTSSQSTVSDLTSRAHARGLSVHPYTFRTDVLPKLCPSADELQAALFSVAQVDGLFTDFTDVTIRWLQKNGKRP